MSSPRLVARCTGSGRAVFFRMDRRVPPTRTRAVARTLVSGTRRSLCSAAVIDGEGRSHPPFAGPRSLRDLRLNTMKERSRDHGGTQLLTGAVSNYLTCSRALAMLQGCIAPLSLSWPPWRSLGVLARPHRRLGKRPVLPLRPPRPPPLHPHLWDKSRPLPCPRSRLLPCLPKLRLPRFLPNRSPLHSSVRLTRETACGVHWARRIAVIACRSSHG